MKKVSFLISPNKMKIGIQEEGKEKQFFFTFKDASEATGISSSIIWQFISNKNREHDKFIRNVIEKFSSSRKKKMKLSSKWME